MTDLRTQMAAAEAANDAPEIRRLERLAMEGEAANATAGWSGEERRRYSRRQGSVSISKAHAQQMIDVEAALHRLTADLRDRETVDIYHCWICDGSAPRDTDGVPADDVQHADDCVYAAAMAALGDA